MIFITIIQLLALLTFIIWSFITAGPANRRTAPKITVRIPITIKTIATLDLLMRMVANSVMPDDSCLCVCWNMNKCCYILKSSPEQWWVDRKLQWGMRSVFIHCRPHPFSHWGLCVYILYSFIPNSCKFMWSHITVRWQLDWSL